MNRPLFFGQLDLFYFFKFFNPALHLAGFGRLVTEAVDKGLQMMNMFLLVSLARFELGPSLGLLFQIAVVISRVEIRAPVPDFQDPVHGDI